MKKRYSLTGLAAALGLLIAPLAAEAQVTNFSGTTSGCFGGDVGCAQVDGTTTVGFLTFTGTTFSVDDYHLDNLTTGVTSDTNNFGLFTLDYSGAGVDPYNDTFTLWIAFTSPTGNTETFNAVLTGNVASSAGGVNITFTSPTEFTWYDGGFAYTVGVINAYPNADGGETQLHGYVMSTTPEPVSIALMGTGLLGLAGLVRRRRKNGDVQNV